MVTQCTIDDKKHILGVGISNFYFLLLAVKIILCFYKKS